MTSMGIGFKWLVEEVASMAQKHRDEISATLGGQPVLLNAADWGWVQRARLYWGLDVPALRTRGHVEIAPAGKLAKDLTVVRYTGERQPKDWTPHDGYGWCQEDDSGKKAMTVPGTGYAATYKTGKRCLHT